MGVKHRHIFIILYFSLFLCTLIAGDFIELYILYEQCILQSIYSMFLRERQSEGDKKIKYIISNTERNHIFSPHVPSSAPPVIILSHKSFCIVRAEGVRYKAAARWNAWLSLVEIQHVTSVGAKPRFLCFRDKHKPSLLCPDAKIEAHYVQTTQRSRWLIDTIRKELPSTVHAVIRWGVYRLKPISRKINGSPNYVELFVLTPEPGQSAK